MESSLLIFLKDLFSIDLFIADAANGKIKNKLINTQTDEHFEALRFTNSSAAWSPDEIKLLPVFKTGDNAIAIYNVKKGRVEQTSILKNWVISPVSHGHPMEKASAFRNRRCYL